ncbi:type II secretion system protein [Planctomycetota bacterium]
MDDWMNGEDGTRTRRLAYPSTHPSSGFTLIELLVVIAVIGILAAILMPAVIRTLKSAKTTHCTSNLKQTAGAFMLYIQYHDGFMTALGSPTGNPPYRFPRWYKALTPFLKDDGVFRCPSKKRVSVGYALSHMWCGPDHIYGEGTAMNNRSKEFDLVQHPSGTIIICDAGYVSNGDDPPADWSDDDSGSTSAHLYFPYDNKPGEPGKFPYYRTSPRRPVPRHVGARTCCMFFDGHVDAILTADIVDDLWDDPNCLYDNDGHPKRKF